MGTQSNGLQVPIKEQSEDKKIKGAKPDFDFSLVDAINNDQKQQEENNSDIGLFTVKSGNQWIEEASKRPIPITLFYELWYLNEICILFADTNLGKSILAVQIGLLLAEKNIVLYLDFELSDKQFELRYSNDYKDHYTFPDGFLRAEINPDEADYKQAGFTTIEDYLNHSIEQMIINTGATILIIDNLTYLRSETEKAKDALPLMKHLKALKSKYGLSILALAHTPKRNLSLPISKNDLQGSKMLMNFCDSAFSIGESTRDKSLRYIKQIKARNTEIIYDSENVAVYQITKPDNYLHFEFLQYGRESDHLKQHSENDREKQKEIAIELNNQGKSLREIATQLGISHTHVNRILKASNNG